MLTKSSQSSLTAQQMLESVGIKNSEIMTKTGIDLINKIINKYETLSCPSNINRIKRVQYLIGTQDFEERTVKVLHNNEVLTCEMFHEQNGDIGFYLNDEPHYLNYCEGIRV